MFQLKLLVCGFIEALYAKRNLLILFSLDPTLNTATDDE